MSTFINRDVVFDEELMLQEKSEMDDKVYRLSKNQRRQVIRKRSPDSRRRANHSH